MAPCVVVERLEGKQQCSGAPVCEHAEVEAQDAECGGAGSIQNVVVRGRYWYENKMQNVVVRGRYWYENNKLRWSDC